MGKLPRSSIHNLYSDAGTTLGLERVLLQILGGKVDGVWAAFVGVLTAQSTTRVETSQVPAARQAGERPIYEQRAWGRAKITTKHPAYWQSCRNTSFSCELDPFRESEAHSSSKVLATASRKSAGRTLSRLANAGAATSLLIALLRYSCIFRHRDC